jgi:hypothetical protein
MRPVSEACSGPEEDPPPPREQAVVSSATSSAADTKRVHREKRDSDMV